MKKNLQFIFIITFILVFMIPSLSEAVWVPSTGYNVSATLALTPNSGLYRSASGVTFDIDIILNTQGQYVNSAQAIINYPSGFFNVTIVPCNDASKPSVFYISGSCSESEASVSGGLIRITRGVNKITSPSGLITSSGLFATLRIQGLGDTAPPSDNFIFDFTSGDPNKSNVYKVNPLGDPTLSGVNNGQFSLDGTAPANVTNLTATPNKGQVTLNWTNPPSDFKGITIVRKTGSYPTSPTDGTVYENDNNIISYVDSGLTNGTTYYYKLYSRDVVKNYSTGAQISAIPNDNTAPAQISNLAVTNLSNVTALKTAALTWTSVGDDGTTGTAASYDIRYSTAAITAANFASATQVTGEPIPKASGSAETMNIAPLSGNTIYYWAIKAVDTAGNSSAISNIPSITTYKASDLNNSGAINGQDFSILLGWWLDISKPAADINQSGQVNGQDFSIMMGEWTG